MTVTRRTIIRSNGSIPAAVVAAMVFGGLAVFGLRVVTLAFSLGEGALWVWGLLLVTLALLWGVIHVLWNAFGVALVIAPWGIRRPGPFRGFRVSAEGLRLGFYDTVRMGTLGPSGNTRRHEVTEVWALCPRRGAVLLMEAGRDAPELARIRQAAELHLGVTPEVMTAQGAAAFT